MSKKSKNRLPKSMQRIKDQLYQLLNGTVLCLTSTIQMLKSTAPAWPSQAKSRAVDWRGLSGLCDTLSRPSRQRHCMACEGSAVLCHHFEPAMPEAVLPPSLIKLLQHILQRVTTWWLSTEATRNNETTFKQQDGHKALCSPRI